MSYYVELKTKNNGVIEISFSNVVELQRYVDTLSESEKERIIAIHKNENGRCVQAWNDITL